MSFDLPADPDAEPTPVETTTLLIYLRGGQTIRHQVSAWDVKTVPGSGDIDRFTWTSRWPGERMPHIRPSAIDAIVVMPAAQT